MAVGDVTVIRVVRGSDSGATRRHGLNPDQLAGRACLRCGGPMDDRPIARVGWVGDVEVKVHSWCLDQWRTAATE